MTKKFILFASAIVLSTAFIGEPRAGNCPPGIVSCSDNCDKTTNNPPHTASGTNCKWSITDEGVLIIESKGPGASTGNYSYGTPWSLSGVKAIVLDGVSATELYGLGAPVQPNAQILTINGGYTRFQSESCSGSSANNCLVEKGFSRNCGSGKYYQERRCVSSCGANFKLNDGECDRIRYTPAEAAAAMNGDDNTITITFKK